jgi:hypothetical protein
MGIIRNNYGVFHLRKKVPKKLEEAVAIVTGAAKPRVAWLKRTLSTKDRRAAKVRAVPVLMEFDRILAQAEALNIERPLRASLSEKEIERIAQYHFATVLAEDDEMRRDGTGSEPLFQSIARQLADAGVELFPLLNPGPRGGFGEAWSKWFGRHIRGLGISNKHHVFHSFRHGFKDALRAAEVSEDVNDALTGQARELGDAYSARGMVPIDCASCAARKRKGRARRPAPASLGNMRANGV